MEVGVVTGDLRDGCSGRRIEVVDLGPTRLPEQPVQRICTFRLEPAALQTEQLTPQPASENELRRFRGVQTRQPAVPRQKCRAFFEPLVPGALQNVPLEAGRDVQSSALVGVEPALESTLVPRPFAEVPFVIRQCRPRPGVLTRRASYASPVLLVRVKGGDPVQGAALPNDVPVEHRSHGSREAFGDGIDRSRRS